MHFLNSTKSLFLFTHGPELKPGPAQTLYVAPKEQTKGDEQLIGAGFRRDFELDQRNYILRVAAGTTNDGDPVSVVVLEHDRRTDFIYYSEVFDEGNFAELEWVGDLDGDKRLDLLLSYFAINGGGEKFILFLSSVAKQDHLVQPYAFFETNFRGC
jgi:hypothetical protein